MKNRININILIAAFLLVGFLSCKNEKPPEFKTTDLKSSKLSNGLPNITGLFNAYRYQDFDPGFVPLEVMDIQYNETTNEIVATKFLGDDAVPTGKVTFRGYYTSNIFDVDLTLGNGVNYEIVKSYLVIDDENTFTMYAYNGFGATNNKEAKFIRRVVK